VNSEFHFFSGTTTERRGSILTCSILNRGVQNYPSVKTEPMGGKSAFLLREKAARAKEVLASFERALREQYEAPLQPLSKRFAELVRNIEQSTNE
jgi:hypothetical protein